MKKKVKPAYFTFSIYEMLKHEVDFPDKQQHQATSNFSFYPFK